MRHPLPLTFLATLTAFAAAQQPISYWVSPSGSDASPGSAASPFATLPRAQAAVRASIAAAGGVLTQDAIVNVLPGVYIQPTPLIFTPADSGASGFVVRWACVGAVLYVGLAIPPALWKPFGASGGVFVANVSSLAPPPPPPPPPPPSAPGCGLVEPGWSYNGNDISQLLVPPNNLTACCDACAATAGCKAWSLCVNITCGTPTKPINCYLKTSAAGRAWFGPLRTSGTLVPPPPPSPPPFKFFTLTEGGAGATIARVPNRGSGYLSSLGVSNSDSSLTWPANSPDFPTAPFNVDNSHVFCNLGADWFTETRPVTALDFAGRTVAFEGRANGVAGCNDKVYLQGPKEFIDEPGEWALEPATGLLYYWPLDPASVTPAASVPIVASPAAAAIEFKGVAGGAAVADIVVDGLEVRGSGFTPDGAYRLFTPGRTNDFPSPSDSGMVRVEDAARISLLNCKLLNAGLSAVWLSHAAANVTVRGCWLEGAGFCGVTAAGIFPGDGPFETAEAANVNYGHVVESNLIWDVGKRVGHGAGVWLWQSGSNLVTHNYIKEAPRNGVGMYGVRFGGGVGWDVGLPPVLYNKSLDFFSGLDVIYTRNTEVSYNLIENVVRDSCDAGAVETWGIGAPNVVHTNSVSDCDSGGVDGSWMNFLFQDDASHWLNHSSNVVFNVAGKGSEEGGMIKSIFSVCENNVVAYSELGHLFNLQPYIEPAAAMTFARNIFAHVVAADGGLLDLSLCDYTAADLAHSCSNMETPSLAAKYNFTNTTTPALSTPVILEFDYNMYWDCAHNATPQGGGGKWDGNAIAADPLFVGGGALPWERTVLDLALSPASPAYSLPGFRRIAVESIGLTPAFAFDLKDWARRKAQKDKVQAETCALENRSLLLLKCDVCVCLQNIARPLTPPLLPHSPSPPFPPFPADDRQVGLWREGSYGISPGTKDWPFAPGAWALYRRVDVAAATVFRIRVKPLAASLTVGVALGTPSGLLATFDAGKSGAVVGVMGTFDVVLNEPLSVSGGAVFLLPSQGCVIDWFQLL